MSSRSRRESCVLRAVILLSVLTCLLSCPVPECMCISKTVMCSSHHLKMVPVFHPDAVIYDKVILTKNNITSLPPRAFWNIKARRLDLSHNPLIRGLSASTFARLELYLEYLDLSYTHIPHMPRDVFSKCVHMRELNLWRTNISKLEAGSFDGLKSLRRLSISHMRIKHLVAGVFYTLQSLEELTIGPGRVSHIERGVFHDTPRLQRLNIFGNKIKTLTGGSFTGLGSLKFLILNDNRIAKIDPGSFIGLNTLRQLSLANNGITTIYPGMFKGLARLKQLHLFRNTISNIGDYALYELTNVKFLWLGENKIRNLGNGCGVRTLKRLRKIWLNGNPIDCDCGMAWLDKLMQKRVLIYGTCGGPKDRQGLYLTDIQVDECRNQPFCHHFRLIHLMRGKF